jgi:HEPN domain-containing protein
MRNFSEIEIRLKDAEYFLRCAEDNLPLEHYTVVVHNAQLCIELSAKAVIAFYEEPTWTHDPSEQFLRILEEHGEELAEMLEVEDLSTLAEDAGVAAPWHVWSVYGKRMEDGTRIAAVDACTKYNGLIKGEVAEDLLERARRSYETAMMFFERVFPYGGLRNRLERTNLSRLRF